MRSYADVARRWVPLTIVGGLLAVAAVAAATATPGLHTIPLPTDSETAGGNAGASPAPAPSLTGKAGDPNAWQLPAWVEWIPAVLVAALVIGIVTLFVLHFIRNNWLSVREIGRDNGDAAAAMTGRREDVIAALDEGLAHLSGGADARAAVIACWVRLEEVAQEAGTPRAVSDAPADLVSRLLRSHQVSTGALTSLADLYRAARYSTTPIDEGMRQRAVAALGQIRQELTTSMTESLVDDGYVATLRSATGSTDPDRRRP